MKHTLLIITALMLVVGCGSDSIKLDINNLIDRGGLMYAPNDDEPFTGIVFDFYENGEKKLNGNYRKGLMNGKWTDWYESGQKSSETTSFKDGIPDGLFTSWYENGQKESEGTFKDGKEDGLHITWFENGFKESEYTYKNGVKVEGSTWYVEQWYENGKKFIEYREVETGNRTSFSYHPNGQKEGETTFKDGKEDGLHTEWHENGQKAYEGTFKDGENISKKCWDEDGNEIECW